MALQGLKVIGRQVHVGLIMTPACVRISMTVAIVCSEIVVFICMTGRIIRRGGNWRRILRGLKENVGEGLITLI